MTGRSITAVVNDHGPHVKGRIIDLSPELFEQLAPLRQGLVRVKVEKVEILKGGEAE